MRLTKARRWRRRTLEEMIVIRRDCTDFHCGASASPYYFGMIAKTLSVLATCLGATLAAAQAPFPVTIRIDASQPKGELKPIWRFFGADEPNYAT